HAPKIAQHVSRRLAAMLLSDTFSDKYRGAPAEQAVACLGRVGACLAQLHGHRVVESIDDFALSVYAALTGRDPMNKGEATLLEAAMVASVDHGVTPPSAQATRIAASVRADFETAVASGLAAVTDVHGGAGAKA